MSSEEGSLPPTLTGSGVLSGIRMIEFGGLGPLPFCATMFADHGAQVVRIERPDTGEPLPGHRDGDVFSRSRSAVAIDLTRDEGRALARNLCANADVVAEGFRPGTMEKLGLGPDTLLTDNSRLVYARMTGWGQYGANARLAGHDINYLALSGALHAIGRPGTAPVVPLNLVADFGGGGMMLAFAIAAALLHSRATGEGQVIDCAMTDGSAMLMSMAYSMHTRGQWRDERGTNLLDGGAYFYDCYETSDGRHVALGAIEPAFRRILLDRLGLPIGAEFDLTLDDRRWAEQKEAVAAVIRSRTRDEWCELLSETDACLTPVLDLSEAPVHPHNVERRTFIDVDGAIQPAPAPRFERTPAQPPQSVRRGPAVLADCGIAPSVIDELYAKGIVRGA
jgi:alpha-methylacyl-CoA racemase